MKYITTDGKEYDFPEMCPYCEMNTGGHQFNCPLYRNFQLWNEFAREDIELAEMGMDEYNKILQREDKK